MNLFDWLDEAKRLEDEIAELEATMLSFGLATERDRELHRALVKKLREANQEINDRTK